MAMHNFLGPEARRLIPIAAALGVLLLAAAATVVSFRILLDRDNEVDRVYRTLIKGEEVFSLVMDLQSSMRGFVISENQQFLDPYRNAMKHLPARLEEFSGLISEVPGYKKHGERLQQLVHARMVNIDSLIELVRKGERERALADISAGEGKAISDSIRVLMDEIEKDEREHLARIQADSIFIIYVTVASIILGYLVSFAILIVGFRALLRELDERMRLQREAVLLNAELNQQAERLRMSNKELEAFSYSVSHDLRSPLRAIDGFSRILEEDYGGKLDDEGRRLFKVIRDNSRKMGRLIDDLLELSRLGRKPLAAAEINTKRLVEEVLGELQAGSERRTRLTIGVLPPAYGDVVLIKQVWVNLLDNAIKFSGKRGQPVVEVSGSVNGTENVYCVKDNGAGFDMRYYDKLFGVFQRLHSAEEFDGTGVGLAIVQRVVSRHGGRVWADGKVGEGASFHFSLPKEKHDGQI